MAMTTTHFVGQQISEADAAEGHFIMSWRVDDRDSQHAKEVYVCDCGCGCSIKKKSLGQ
jgi:hypothetical protein